MSEKELTNDKISILTAKLTKDLSYRSQRPDHLDHELSAEKNYNPIRSQCKVKAGRNSVYKSFKFRGKKKK